MPSEDCKGWLDHGHPIHEQTQVLLANANVVLGKLTLQQKKQMLAVLSPTGVLSGATLSSKIMSALTCIPARTVENVARDVAANGFVPKPSTRILAGTNSSTETNQQRSHDSKCSEATWVRNLVRLALSNAVQGRPHKAFPNDVNLMALSGASVGTVHHSRNFANLVERTAAAAAKEAVGECLNYTLAGIGIPSDLELMADGATATGLVKV